jgi:hypothetical protein
MHGAKPGFLNLMIQQRFYHHNTRASTSLCHRLQSLNKNPCRHRPTKLRTNNNNKKLFCFRLSPLGNSPTFLIVQYSPEATVFSDSSSKIQIERWNSTAFQKSKLLLSRQMQRIVAQRTY